MISSAHLVWLAVDSPRQPGCVDTPGELCWVCAGPADRSVARVDWLGASYTGQNRVKYPAGTRICEPCIFLHSRTSPVPGREAKEGKKFGGNWRNYCVMVEVVEGAPPLLWTATKGEKALVREFLFRVKHGTWFCSIADSGQKHTVPGCPVNPPGTWGRVRFEETDLVIGPNLPALVTSITEILTLGASKEGVETGEHHMLTWGRIPEELQAFEDTWGHRWRGSDGSWPRRP